MIPKVLTGQQVREFDRIAIEEFQINSLVLMENAARGATDVLCSSGISGPVAICCGRGNNGGDGLVMARHLHLRGHDVKVLLFANFADLSQDSAVNHRILGRTAVPILAALDLDRATLAAELRGCEWIIDALLGTGARPPLRTPLDWLVPLLNQLKCRKMAIDLPTGLNCDADDGSGQADGEVFNADLTCTFVAFKPAMQFETGRQVCGDIRLVDIGAPPEVFDLLDAGG